MIHSGRFSPVPHPDGANSAVRTTIHAISVDGF